MNNKNKKVKRKEGEKKNTKTKLMYVLFKYQTGFCKEEPAFYIDAAFENRVGPGSLAISEIAGR